MLVPTDGSAPRILSAPFLEVLQLGPEGQAFGPKTAVQWGDPRLGLVRHVRQVRGSKPVTVQLYVHGQPGEWDPVAWAGRGLVRQLRELSDVRVRLMVPAAPDELDWQARRQLVALAEAEGLDLAVAAEGTAGSLVLWATVDNGAEAFGFATESEVLPFSSGWTRRVNGAMFVTGPLPAQPTRGEQVDPGSLVAEPEPGIAVVDLQSTGGPAREYGERFWRALDGGCPGLLDAMRSLGAADRIEVQDRYLVSPLVVQALHAVLDESKRVGALGPTTRVEVYTQACRGERPPKWLRDDWDREADQKDVLEGLLGAVAKNVQVVLIGREGGKRLQHHRSITLSWGDKEWEIRLDSGFGYLTAAGDDRFPFSKDRNGQVTKLLQGNWELRTPRTEVPAYVLRA